MLIAHVMTSIERKVLCEVNKIIGDDAHGTIFLQTKTYLSVKNVRKLMCFSNNMDLVPKTTAKLEITKRERKATFCGPFVNMNNT